MFNEGVRLPVLHETATGDIKAFFDNFLGTYREVAVNLASAEEDITTQAPDAPVLAPGATITQRIARVVAFLQNAREGTGASAPYSALLADLRRALNEFSPSAYTFDGQFPPQLVSLCLEDFGSQVCGAINASDGEENFAGFSFNTASQDEFPLPMLGFRSWLLVRPDLEQGSSSALVVFDEKGILASSSDPWLVFNRWLRSILHEIGHARIDMDYYLASGNAETGVRALPVQETRAWVYANDCMTLISALRSQIDRYLSG